MVDQDAAGAPREVQAEAGIAGQEAVRRAAQAAQARRRRRGRERLRRRPRGRADLRLHLRAVEGHKAGAPAVGELDDARRDPGRLRGAARRVGDGESGGRRPLPVGGRLAGRHELHPGGHRARPGTGRGRFAGPGADADAGPDRPPRPGDRRLRPRDLLPGRCPLPAGRRAQLHRPLVLGQGRPHPPAGAGGRRSRRRPGKAGLCRAGQEDRAQDPAATALRPDLAAARREQPLRALGLAHAAGRAAPV